MKILIGLGNPETRYGKTRHNAGFRVIDKLARDHMIELRREAKFRAEVGSMKVDSERVLLVKPLTFMNLSGEAVQAVLHFYKIENLEEVLVVHDDVSLPLGRIKMQKGGGAGGQHGVESIIAMLSGRKEFHRLKFGVGPDPGGKWRSEFVVSQFQVEDVELNEKVIGKSCDAALTWIRSGVQETMNAFNGAVFGLPFCLQDPDEDQSDDHPNQPNDDPTPPKTGQ